MIINDNLAVHYSLDFDIVHLQKMVSTHSHQEITILKGAELEVSNDPC